MVLAGQAKNCAAMKRAGPVLKVKDLQPRSAIFMLGGAPTAHEVLPDKCLHSPCDTDQRA
jgi:hypothetical protein